MSKPLRNTLKFLPLVVIPLLLLGLLIWYVSTHTIAVLSPAGPVAASERNLMLVAVILAAVVVIPVYTLTIFIAIRYRATNKKAKYEPDWDHNKKLELTWWGIPLVIIAILSVITWISSHALDPFKPLASNKAPLTVDVVALDWKWLFIYPAQNIASVNLLEAPAGTPINLNLTSDTVMNSFWVPRLAGQIYAMPGMSTQLHLEASKSGSYFGSPANISGTGFARMDFTVKATSDQNFASWVNAAVRSNRPLTNASYNTLAVPSDNNPAVQYSSVESGLYNYIMAKYMEPNAPVPTGGSK